MGQRPDTFDELCTLSLAFREFLDQAERARAEAPPDQAQIDALTGDYTGPAVFDLTAIWRASLADPRSYHVCSRRGGDSPHSRRYLSPRRFLGRWSVLVTHAIEAGRGRVLADGRTALIYCGVADVRVFVATMRMLEEERKAATRRDPIGTAVAASKGGWPAMMEARSDVRDVLGLSDEDFNSAVLERARSEASTMGDYPAERLLSEVRRALAGPTELDLAELTRGRSRPRRSKKRSDKLDEAAPDQAPR